MHARLSRLFKLPKSLINVVDLHPSSKPKDTMKFLLLTALIAMVSAETQAEAADGIHKCSGLYNQAQCCSSVVLGLAALDCNPGTFSIVVSTQCNSVHLTLV